MSAEHFDVIVVGSGSAGGTVASRLSEDPECRVLMLEAGPDFPDEAIRPPSFYVGGALNGERGAGSGSPSPEMDWGFEAEPLPDGRRIGLPRGRLVGGSSMVNGCIAVRGRPEDFARWVDAGAVGWDWDAVLPYFELVERELHVRTYPRELWLPVQNLVVDGFRELGFRYCDDLNAPDAWGEVCGPWPRNRRNEIRMGTLPTYIRAARPRPNFAIRAGAVVDRVLIDGNRAVGISYQARNGIETVTADRIVLSAGVYGSPPILMRSGIGPAEQLRALGIDVVADLPVGRGLLDHPGLAFPIAVSGRFARMGWPGYASVARGNTYWAIPMTADEEAGIVMVAFFLGLVDGPRGTIEISSTDPQVKPTINHGYLTVIDEDLFAGVWHDFQLLLATSAFRDAEARDVDEGVPLRERLLGRMSCGAPRAGGCGRGRGVDLVMQV
jgi:choline dehydrogenase